MWRWALYSETGKKQIKGNIKLRGEEPTRIS